MRAEHQQPGEKPHPERRGTDAMAQPLPDHHSGHGRHNCKQRYSREAARHRARDSQSGRERQRRYRE
jgi:hypothetical protein